MKEFPCGWGRQGRIFPQVAISGMGNNGMTLYTPFSGDCDSSVKGYGSWDVPPESRASATQGTGSAAGCVLQIHMQLLALLCAPGFEDIFGRHTVCSIIWTSWGQFNCNPDKPDTKNRLQM